MVTVVERRRSGIQTQRDEGQIHRQVRPCERRTKCKCLRYRGKWNIRQPFVPRLHSGNAQKARPPPNEGSSSVPTCMSQGMCIAISPPHPPSWYLTSSGELAWGDAGNQQTCLTTMRSSLRDQPEIRAPGERGKRSFRAGSNYLITVRWLVGSAADHPWTVGQVPKL